MEDERRCGQCLCSTCRRAKWWEPGKDKCLACCACSGGRFLKDGKDPSLCPRYEK